MGWRVVKQPNGKYARFSDVVDDFTVWNMTRAEVIELIAKKAYEEALRIAEEKLKGADDDVCRSGKKGRWKEALGTIAMIHGREKLNEFLTEYEKAKDE